MQPGSARPCLGAVPNACTQQGTSDPMGAMLPPSLLPVQPSALPPRTLHREVHWATSPCCWVMRTSGARRVRRVSCCERPSHAAAGGVRWRASGLANRLDISACCAAVRHRASAARAHTCCWLHSVGASAAAHQHCGTHGGRIKHVSSDQCASALHAVVGDREHSGEGRCTPSCVRKLFACCTLPPVASILRPTAE